VRLWTLHPRYLDPQGLVAVWREALLAQAVLRGRTKGYRHHPQLDRFRSHAAPRSAINAYLAAILAEAERRGYSFDARKLGPIRSRSRIQATSGQLAHEWRHLLAKLRARSPQVYRKWRGLAVPESQALFKIVAGPIAEWERGGTGRGHGSPPARG
jgi:Pyrimidine dimer DNA glycosylase